MIKMKANEILKKHEDKNEMHFHDVDRKFIIEAMEEYAALCKAPIVCSACGDSCERNGFSPQGTVEWFCSQECYESYFENIDDSF